MITLGIATSGYWRLPLNLSVATDGYWYWGDSVSPQGIAFRRLFLKDTIRRILWR